MYIYTHIYIYIYTSVDPCIYMHEAIAMRSLRRKKFGRTVTVIPKCLSQCLIPNFYSSVGLSMIVQSDTVVYHKVFVQDLKTDLLQLN